MIYKDQDGYPVDRTGDGGDSAFRAGLLETFAGEKFSGYLQDRGLLCRHPKQAPWNNPWNFSRDQLIVKSTGFWATRDVRSARTVFWSHAIRLFFCQNFHRDSVGTVKRPWPERIRDGDPKDIGQWRFFDFADVLMPDQILHLILCSRIWWLYPWGLIGLPWFFLSLLGHALTRHREHHQILCQAWVLGPWAVWMFKVVLPSWKKETRAYWACRQEEEYADLILRAVAPSEYSKARCD